MSSIPFFTNDLVPNVNPKNKPKKHDKPEQFPEYYNDGDDL